MKKWLYILLLMLCSCSFPSRRAAALRTVAEADSLDRAGMLFTDTLRLQEAGDVLNSFLDRTEKAKALYYSGRNYSMQNEDARAVDYYISADRLRPQDAQLRGRLNCNMAYICAQQNKDELAIMFYEREYEFREQTKSYELLFSCLLDMSLSLCKSKQYAKADSVWKQALNYSKSSHNVCRAMGIRAFYFNTICDYDSALHYLSLVSSPEIVGCDFFYAQKAWALFSKDSVDSAVYYSNKILNDTLSAVAFKETAINILIAKAFSEKNLSLVKSYDEQLEQIIAEARFNDEQRVRAITKLEKYLKDEDNDLPGIVIIVFILLLAIFFFIIVIVNKRRIVYLKLKRKELKHIEKYIDSNVSFQNKMIIENISKIQNDDDWRKLLHWSNKQESLKQIDLYFNHFASRLKNEYNLNVVEIQYCTMLLLGFNNKEISDKLPYSFSGLKTLKKRTADKLFILPQNMTDFLKDFALKIGSSDYSN